MSLVDTVLSIVLRHVIGEVGRLAEFSHFFLDIQRANRTEIERGATDFFWTTVSEGKGKG